MKKGIIVLLALLTLALGIQAPSFAAEYELKMQTYYPASMLSGMQHFVDNVQTMSNGRVKINLFSGGELVGSGNILKAVKSGMIDLGQGMGHHFTEMPTGTLESGLPMSWMSSMEADILLDHKGLRKIFEEEYARAGVVYLGATRAAPYQIISKKPIHSLDDLRKMKIRAVGASAKMLTAVGVSCVNLPTEDIYVALTTGQIDGVLFGSASDYKAMKYYEVAKYLNTTSLIDPISDTLIVNKRLWNKFPDDLKAIFRIAARNATLDYYTWSENDSLSAMVELFAGNTTSFSEKDKKELIQAAMTVWDTEAKRSPNVKKGVEILKKFAKEKGRL